MKGISFVFSSLSFTLLIQSSAFSTLSCASMKFSFLMFVSNSSIISSHVFSSSIRESAPFSVRSSFSSFALSFNLFNSFRK